MYTGYVKWQRNQIERLTSLYLRCLQRHSKREGSSHRPLGNAPPDPVRSLDSANPQGSRQRGYYVYNSNIIIVVTCKHTSKLICARSNWHISGGESTVVWAFRRSRASQAFPGLATIDTSTAVMVIQATPTRTRTCKSG
jgi:hypothetical protein